MEAHCEEKSCRPYLYLAPSIAVIGLIVIFPILYTGYISLTNMNIYHWFHPGFIGLENYEKAIFVFDSGFLSALLRTVLWTGINMVLQMVVAYIIAVLLNTEGLRAHKFYKTILMFPWALDGAGFFTKLGKITIPLVRPVIAPAVVITIFTTFKQFDIVYLLTQQQGSKTGADIHTVITYTYEKAFVTNNYGYSAAVSVLIFLLLILFSMFTNKELKEGYR
ncbi:hypothetical protein A7X67_00055 [Clostridium sp. W14A]|nr:hypothetical protein A7X67_00055 [Clostridium sp. W14A]